LVPLSELLSGGARVPSVPTVPTGSKGFVPKAVPSAPSSPSRQPVAQAPSPRPQAPSPQSPASGDSGFKDRFLAELKSSKSTFYNLVVASAFRIDATPSGIVFAFLPNQKNAKSQCDEQKPWLASIAEKVAGRAVPVTIAVADAGSAPAPAPASPVNPVAGPKLSGDDLKAEAMANSTVQAVLEIFPVDKTTIEER
jgi:hypothetical protein